MFMSTKSKVIVITGASSGIGLETANYLLKKGHIVYGIARRQMSDLDFHFMQGDVTDSQRMNDIFQEIENKEGRIDVLINNAGMGISGAIEHTSDEDIKKIFDINVNAVVSLSRAIIPFLRRNNGGKIINIGSVAGVIPIPFQACYSASKAAIEIFSMALNSEVKPFGIRVACVRPGDTKTGFTQARVKNKVLEDENYDKRIAKSIEKMEKDEQHGMKAVAVSKVVEKVIRRKSPPLVCTVGFGYKCIVVLAKILPTRLMNAIVKKIYG